MSPVMLFLSLCFYIYQMCNVLFFKLIYFLPVWSFASVFMLVLHVRTAPVRTVLLNLLVSVRRWHIEEDVYRLCRCVCCAVRAMSHNCHYTVFDVKFRGRKKRKKKKTQDQSQLWLWYFTWKDNLGLFVFVGLTFCFIMVKSRNPTSHGM